MATDVRPRDPSIQSPMVPLATLIGLEIRGGKSEKPSIKYGNAAFAKRGEDYFLVRPDCFRVPGDATSLFSVFAIFDGHNGASAAVFAKEHLLDHVMSVIPQGISREEWLEALPRALVAGFVKADTDFQRKGETSGTTATLVVIDGWTVTVASVGDSRCILDSQDGVVSLLTVDHRLEENVEERERVTASGGEVGRLNLCGGKEVGPLRCWPGGLCLSRSIGDTDVGEFIVPIPHVKQVKLSAAGGRLIIASDGIWDALPSELAAKACRGLPAELAAKLVVKEALRKSGLKDDTTCLVVDIIPPEHTFVQSPTIKQQNKFRSLIFGKKSKNGVGKPTKLSSVGAVEELFEEGSAMLEERLGKNFSPTEDSGTLRCAICQTDRVSDDDLLIDSSDSFSATSKAWEGPYLCHDCRRKKDAMEGKRPRESTMSR
ncbi:probable protein phosphatase 2C 33 [Zingiber officinale]|uniref:probable protein phosphatase 2C 33 n=1 Tax=Zingiber officinale TaxID=94328 RepID=UPI001C4B8063|nr:probable protein phosphatase 2C 33 [Zingiber officinale]XP_042422575.1 probable protein phosphatase 2C 33 [Zingiber officinale]XP_042422576.1 probable protein phosphatase 2C 33 [Zingiber officinale]XP_042422577.1 probable protein phosphatase 2C 33 [Zingiber officinale]